MQDTILYNKLGQGYNTTRKADPYIAGRLLSMLAPLPGKTYLDIGCGTGNYTAWFADRGLDFIGIDPSGLMLEEARGKSADVRWMSGSAENIPLADDSLDGAIATLTVHHWTDREKSFREIARVLKPGSRLVIFSFTPEQERGYWFNHFFPKMMAKSQFKAVQLETIIDSAEPAGFTLVNTEKYFVQENLQDMFGYSGKHNPEIYFDPIIRNGISSFSILADKQEVEEGLKKLRTCIDNGEFGQVKEQYKNDTGDYLFIVLEKQ